LPKLSLTILIRLFITIKNKNKTFREGLKITERGFVIFLFQLKPPSFIYEIMHIGSSLSLLIAESVKDHTVVVLQGFLPRVPHVSHCPLESITTNVEADDMTHAVTDLLNYQNHSLNFKILF
jgi:hypothetical protein